MAREAVKGEIQENVEGLSNALSQEQFLEAAEDAFKRMEDEAVVAKEKPNTRSMRGIINNIFIFT
jgi:hypothetical protein